MTDEMLQLANENKTKLAASNVEFRKGEMESMPVADSEKKSKTVGLSVGSPDRL